MRNDRERLRDSQEAIHRIEKYATQGKEEFFANELIQSWILLQLQIIGEAARSMDSATHTQCSEISWRNITRRLNHYLVNMRYASTQRITEPRFSMEENYWVAHGNAADLECPPSGKLIHAKYANGDEFRVEFIEIANKEAMLKRYPKGHPVIANLPFPITAVEIIYRVPGEELDIASSKTNLSYFTSRGEFMRNCATAFRID
jgi:uncharacterized protein with HEPN domain